MGIGNSCCSKEHISRIECFIETNIEEDYIIYPNLLPSEVGIKRRAVKRMTSEPVLITSLYKKATNELSLLLQETSILKNLKHPNIIVLFGVYEDETVFHEVTEDFQGTTLLDLLQEKQVLDETTTRKIARKILRALDHMHKQKIYYGNLTLNTVKVLNSSLKLIDFTNSNYEDENFSMAQCNYNFLPPEAFGEIYTCASDLWSLGILIFYLLKGTLPFDGKEKSDIIQKIQESDYSLAGISSLSKEFIKSLLQKNPASRPTADTALSHVWMQNILDLD